MNRSNPEDVISRLKQAGTWSKKKLGQHFLVDENALAAIVESAKVQSGDLVVEIGPGLGVLSEALLGKTPNVLAFEYDLDMQIILAQDFPELEVVPGDVLRTAAPALAGRGEYKVVANIPYQITTPLLRLFLEGGVESAPASLTLLVQEEVGKRLSAPAGHSARSYLSVLCQYYAEVTYVREVRASSFMPPPAVDSAIVHLGVRTARALSIEQERPFLRFVKASFAQRRKQLKKVLAGIRGVSTAEMGAYLAHQGLPVTVRAQELTLGQWISLFNHPFS